MSPIRVETGPMFARKSTELEAQWERYYYAEKVQGKDYLVFNHAADKRYGVKVVATHNGKEVKADAAVNSSAEILEHICSWNGEAYGLKPEFESLEGILIDEAQFFDNYLPDVVEFMSRGLGLDVFIYGLDTDFRGEGFGPMPELMARADEVLKHTAICTGREKGKRCGKAATKTQRLVNGKPANYNDPIILVGAKEAYTARCEKHHEVPDRPILKPRKS